jgi:hypothetical protein
MAGAKIKEANTSGKKKPNQPCDPTTPTCKSDQPKKPRIGVVIAIYPALFKKNEYPKELKDFKPVEEKLFHDEYFLLADGVQEAVIAIQIVDIDKSKSKLKNTSASGGEVVIKTSNVVIGQIKHKADGKPAGDIRIPVSEIKGEYKNCFFKTTKAINSTDITCTIEKPDPSYDYVSVVTIPPKENWSNNLKIQTRELKKGDKGYDVMKLQWYLRRFGYFKNDMGDDGNCDGEFGKRCERAINRLQRRAVKPYRNKRGKKPDQTDTNDAKTSELFTGTENGNADLKTIEEIIKWYDKDWIVPLGRLGTQNVLFDTKYKKLRSDIVPAFNNLRKEIYDNGGTLDDESSTLRSFDQPVTSDSGRSRTSNHYCGFAIDLAQDDKLYYPVRDPAQPVGTNPYTVPFWTIYTISKNNKGSLEKKGFKKAYYWADRDSKNPTGKDRDIPAGNYINLSEIFTRHGFVSIVPHQNYEKDKHYNHQEWWHFHYVLKGKVYLQDEVELVDISYSEKFLKSNPNTKLRDDDLDNPPA